MNNPETRKRWNKNHPEKVKQSKKKWNENNPAYQKQYRKDNIKKQKQYRKDNCEEQKKKNNKHYKERNLLINNYKISHGCAICGYNKCGSALCFHHEGDDKEFSIASMKTCNWERVNKEIKKCVILCSNCHAELHEQEKRM